MPGSRHHPLQGVHRRGYDGVMDDILEKLEHFLIWLNREGIPKGREF
jgi:hypothetical protein